MTLITPSGRRALTEAEKTAAQKVIAERKRIESLAATKENLVGLVLSELSPKHAAEEQREIDRIEAMTSMQTITDEMTRRKFQWHAGQPESLIKADKEFISKQFG